MIKDIIEIEDFNRESSLSRMKLRDKLRQGSRVWLRYSWIPDHRSMLIRNYTNRTVRNDKTQGFSLIEVLVVIVIALIIGGIVFTSFSALNNTQALNTETDTVLSMIERAKSRSVSSENSIEYGIHFASSSVVLFVGKTYPAGSSTNETENINSKVLVKSISLTGGVSNVYFNKLSGKPSATGTIVFSLAINASTTKTITIYNTGLTDSY